MNIITFELDNPTIKIPITTEPDGNILNLSDSSVEAWAEKIRDRNLVKIDSEVTDEVEGIVTLTLVQDAFVKGTYRLQVRVTKDSETQTVVDTSLKVERSLRSPT